MTPEQENLITNRLNEFTLQLSEHLAETVRGVVKVTVNGKIDNLKKTLDDHIEKVEPMMNQFEKFTIGKELAITGFRVVAWIGGLVVTLGGAYLIVKQTLKVIVLK